jgi:hypothetical protein
MFFCFLLSSVFALDLRITEIFVDGSDERVEISNIWTDDFVWSFTLSGVKSSPLLVSNVTIPSFTSLLVGDAMSMFSLPNTFNILWWRGLSLWDTAWVDISLIEDGGSIADTFVVDQSLVQSSDNTMTSFQKLYNGWWFDILSTLSSFSLWVITPSVANPAQVYHIDWSTRLPIAIDIWTGTTSSWSITSWSIDTGSTSSWFFVDCSTSWSGVLLVDEVYLGDNYNHYIEILFLQDWTWSLQLSWNALSSSFILPSQWYQANIRYLITSNNSGFHHTDNIILIPDLVISSGNFIIQDAWSSLSYYAYIDSTWQSVYYSNTDTCIQNISLVANPSPWFDRQFLWYLNTQTITNTIIQTVTGSCITWSNTSTGTTPSTGDTWINLLSGILNFHDVRISLIDYDPVWSDTNNERIGLTLFTWESLSLSWWSLWYDGKTYKFLSWIIISGSEYIRTANFWFVNSRTICISLYYLGSIIDTVCYDPTVQESPIYPLTISTGDSVVVSGDDETFDYNNLQFDILSLVYDPDGSDTDRETVTIKFISGADSILLDNLRLRVGTTNKRIYGIILSWQTLTLMGNYQMPNSKPTCIALSYNEIIYDEYCYTPSTSSSTQTSSPYQFTSTSFYTDRIVDIVDLEYDPEGNDTDREMITIVMTGWQSSVDLSKLYLRFGTTKRYLNGMLYSDTQTIVTGNYQMPNSKQTCVDLMEWSHIFDTYCYDPLWEDPTELISTGTIQTGDQIITDSKEYYSGLQLQRILPNPKDKDIKNLNEKFALWRENWSGQILTKRVKLLVGKTSISLSWYQFTDDELIVASSKALTNQAACVRLMIDNQEIDRFCYPQAKEWLIYYHPRLDKWPQTIPSSLIDSLDSQWVDLSELRLTKSGKQICLTYDKVYIRCMNGGSTSTSAKNKALLTLGNAYIRKMSELVYAKQMDYILMEQWRQAYRTLSDEIKWWNLWTITLYGQSIKITDIELYVTALYTIDEDQYMTDQISRIFFWHQAVDNYYRQLYK